MADSDFDQEFTSVGPLRRRRTASGLNFGGSMANSADGISTSGGSARELLASIPFLAYAPPALRTAFVRAAEVVRLEAGGYFHHEGDPCTHFAVLVSGRIRVFKFAETGHEITLYSVGPGEACPLSV